ncbi:MAG: Clp protease ClpP [Staphylococcus sp.]|nr:Clp protease ClpP [Staphylococcus sp.]
MTYQLTIDDYIGRWCYSKQWARKELAKFKGKHVDVLITSLGGDLDHGLDIRQQLIDHGDVTVYLTGFVASSATVIAMGAKRVVMSKYAMFLVHKCSNFIDAWGSYNADQMQQLIDDLTANKKENDKIDVVLASMYANRCGKQVSDILDILKEGRWLTAEEALDYGFIDEIADIKEEGKLNFGVDLKNKFNAMGLSLVGLEQLADPEPEPEPEKSNLLTRVVKSIFSADTKENNTDTTPNMKKTNFSFTALCSLLALESITIDNDGDVTLTAEQMEKINNRIAELENASSSLDKDIKEKDDKISQLESQVEALKKAPGDETNEIEDEAGEDTTFSVSDVYNSIKSII